MKEYAFQFAILRYVHDVVTQEFINVGVVVYAQEQRYIKARVSRRYSRLSKTFPGINRDFYQRVISHVEQSFMRLQQEFQPPKTKEPDDLPSRIEVTLQQVLPPDDSSLRFGGIGGGITDDLDAELNRLYERLVERYIEAPQRSSREERGCSVLGDQAKRDNRRTSVLKSLRRIYHIRNKPERTK
ncbi:MAG: DUF3037 domain-containing protein [Anaerolineae bacterium]|nr:DUF3037 domain-containing protein [Anaerolineae bacterium]